MYLLQFYQSERELNMGLFDTIENGRRVLEQIPGYQYEQLEGYERETLDYTVLPDYMECEYNGNQIILTRFIFVPDETIEVAWISFPNLEERGDGVVEGATRVDAYLIENSEVASYIQKRENNASTVVQLLKKLGYESQRCYSGSEDGEALLARRQGEEDWRFISHLDPIFTRETLNNHADVVSWLKICGFYD